MADGEELALGVDLGTTSVKACVCARDGRVLAKQSKDAAADVPGEGSEQDVPKLASALHGCVSRLPRDLLRRVTRVGVCGQMHGALLWRSAPRAWDAVEKEGALVRYEAARGATSHLYTWQDGRCDAAFLASLPAPRPHSGYGCATLFWLARRRPEELAAFDRAGTVQDFIVAMLCDLDAPRTTPQLAASWGYYSPESGRWLDEELSAAGFPTRLLPEVVPADRAAGRLARAWCGVPAGALVGAALGDLQCSFLATLELPSDAVLNVSTSAQLGFAVERRGDDSRLEYVPYFGGALLAVAASLNGGNALAALVRTLQQWCGELGHAVPQSVVWERLVALGSAPEAESSLRVSPLLLGERRDPSLRGSASGVEPGNLSLGCVFRAACDGLVENLRAMMPREALTAAGVRRILGNGSALARNRVLQSAVERGYDLPLVFTSGGDAAKGAALAAFRLADS